MDEIYSWLLWLYMYILKSLLLHFYQFLNLFSFNFWIQLEIFTFQIFNSWLNTHNFWFIAKNFYLKILQNLWLALYWLFILKIIIIKYRPFPQTNWWTWLDILKLKTFIVSCLFNWLLWIANFQFRDFIFLLSLIVIMVKTLTIQILIFIWYLYYVSYGWWVFQVFPKTLVIVF